MFTLPSLARRTSKLAPGLLLTCALLATAFAQNQGPRRPLPKPPAGSRGFEQYGGKDASSRLIAAGATRGPLKPVAPYEGIAYDPRPLFVWAAAPGAPSYHFTLRDGPDSAAKAVFETDVKTAELQYPADAPALVPGKVYQWRVSVQGVMERKQGAPATFFVLQGDDAAQVAAALKKAKLDAPKTPAERLKQARVFEEYGVWYDALRVARELTKADPGDAAAKEFYDSLVKRLADESQKITNQSSSALPLWKELEPAVARGDDRAARSLIGRDTGAARALYRELLFEAATAALYEDVGMPHAEKARKLIAESDAAGGALEAKFAEWSKEKKAGVGFLKESEGVGQLIYLTVVAYYRGKDKDVDKEAPAGTPRELTERALALAESSGVELAVACFSGNLGVYALREKRLDDVRPLVERSGEIWARWNHRTGLAQVPLLLGQADYEAQNWKDAAENFGRGAELARALPELRPYRVIGLSSRAAALRNLGDKEGVRAALESVVEEQRKLVNEAKDSDSRLIQSKNLADFEIQLGGALAALTRHVEAGEWYARAEKLRQENYKIESAQLEAQIVDYTTKFQARISEAKTEGDKKVFRKTLETVTDLLLMQLDSLASQNKDTAMLVKIAERRLALAREGGDTDNIARALENLADAERKADDLPKARSTAEEALRLRSSLPRRTKIYDTLYLLGNIAYYAEDWGLAIAKYKEVVELTKPDALPPFFDLDAEPDKGIRLVRARMNATDRIIRESRALDAKTAIAYIHIEQGNYAEADRLLEQVSRSVPRLYAFGAPDEAELLKWVEDGKNPELTTVDVAAHRRQAGFTPDKAEEERLSFADLAARAHRAAVISHRAALYESQNDLDRAAKTYERANAMFANFVGGSFTLSGTYVALARIERARGNFQAAEAPVAAALAEFERNHQAWGIANMLSFQSMLRREEGRLEESRKLAEDALKIARQLNTRSQTAGILRTLGRAEGELGGEYLKQSEQHLRESLALWRELGLRAHVAYTLDSLGQTLERMKRDDEALNAYVEAVGIVETLVGSLSKDVNAETFNASRGNKELYDHLIKLLIRKGRTGEALSYLERAKSKALVDALAGANVNAKDPALKSLLDRVRESGNSLRVAEKELATELAKPENQRDAAKVAGLRAKLSAAQKSYLDSVEQIKRANPSYASLVAVNPTNLAEIRDRLPEKTVLLEYFPTDKELHIFVVTRDQPPSIRTITVGREQLAKLVLQYREALGSASEPGVLERSARGALWKDDGKEDFKRDVAPIKEATLLLYDALIVPVQSEVDQSDTLLIVPAAELYYLPFHALGRAREDGSINFLIEQKRFAYLPSADLLKVVITSRTAGGESAKGGRTLLALGNPDGSLPAATEEVSALGRIFSGANVYTGKDATVTRVSQKKEPAAFIHFATHGIINSFDPKESYLLLAGQPDRLSVKDIVEDNYKLSLDGSRLVTLSACETSIGGYDPSAVYSSLSRAFAKAGAPTVVASLWSVNDVSTRDTMKLFYQELAAGQSKAEAMRRAQLAVMRDPRFAHPYFWAPFVLLGEW
ncbi:MAG TPA: CHAT domain-containing protein [Pyrinomonadaceae bacterium]